MPTSKTFPTGTIVLFIVIVTLLVVTLITLSREKKILPKELIAVLRPEAVPLKPFTLTDHNGKLYTEQSLKGKWSFFFFGYTYCPDICPTTLASLKLMSKELQKTTDIMKNSQILFVSVDPARDTPEVLARYMNYFGPGFTGLTGFPNSIDELARQFGATYIKEKETTPGNYLVSHTSSVFLAGPQGRIIASFSPPHNAEVIADLYSKIRELYKP